MTDVINRIKTSPIKIPIVLFICPIIFALYFILQGIFNVFSLLELVYYSINVAYWSLELFTRLSFLATGLYLGVLFIKEKNAWYIAAAVAFVIRFFFPDSLMDGYVGTIWERLMVWLACGITLAMPALQTTELQDIGKKTVVLAGVYAILSGVFTCIHMNYLSVWYWFFSVVTHIVVCFELDNM